MKICYLGNINSIHLRKMAGSLASRGNDVHIISLQIPKTTIEGVKIHIAKNRIHEILSKIPFIGEKLWFTVLRIFIYILRPDILHAHYLTDYGDICGKIGIRPFVVSIYGSDILLDIRNDGNAIEKCVLEKADLVICDGQNVLKKLTDLGMNMEKVRLIFIGVDIRKFKPRDICHNPTYSKDHRFTIVSTRKLFPLYDIDMLILSIPIIIRKCDKIRIVLVGDGPEKERLINLVKEKQIEEYVEFLGTVDNDRMPEILTMADIYVSTSSSDAGLAVSTAEAMACGLPVIVTDNSDNRLWIKDYHNGFVIQSGSPIQLAESILFLIDNPNLISEYGKNNRALISEGFSIDSEMEKIEAEYSNYILGERK